MRLNYVSLDALKTGNTQIDKDIEFLVTSIRGDFTQLFDEKWSISCDKVEQAIKRNSYNLPIPVYSEVKETAQKIKEIFQKNFNLNFELKSAMNIDDAKNLISAYGNIPLNIHSFNTLLWKCTTISQAESIIAEFGEKMTFSLHTYTTLYKILLNDIDSPIGKVKSFLPTILERINDFWRLDGKSRPFMKAILRGSPLRLTHFVWDEIEKRQLNNLREIIEKPIKTNNFLRASAKSQNQRQNPHNPGYEAKLAEARAAGLWDLAHLYASWQLSQEIGWWGKGHRKNGSTFGKWKKEM